MTDTQHNPVADLGGFQKIRLAHDVGKNGEKLPAARGHFSESFYKTLRAALRLAPGVVQHVLTMINAKGGTDDRVDGSREAPLPMNTQAFNDVNEVYSRLVYWATLYAERLHRQAPGPAKRAWRASGNNTIAGLPADITPDAARYVVGIMAKWLEVNLEDILALPELDDTQYFRDEFAGDIFRINAANPQRMKARYSDVHCPDDDCRGKIAVYPPRFFQDDERIVCEGCGRRFFPKDYARLVEVFNQIRAESNPVARHLMKKYGKTA